MKTIILFLVFTVSCAAQTNLSERDAISKDHINLAKQQVYFEIHGLVELDGHTFLDDTCSNPFMFYASADEITLSRKTDNGERYRRRHCNVKDCPILHLELIVAVFTVPSQPSYWFRTIPLLNGVTTPATIQDNVK